MRIQRRVVRQVVKVVQQLGVLRFIYLERCSRRIRIEYGNIGRALAFADVPPLKGVAGSFWNGFVVPAIQLRKRSRCGFGACRISPVYNGLRRHIVGAGDSICAFVRVEIKIMPVVIARIEVYIVWGIRRNGNYAICPDLVSVAAGVFYPEAEDNYRAFLVLNGQVGNIPCIEGYRP